MIDRRGAALLAAASLALALQPATTHAAAGLRAVTVVRDRLWVPESSGEETPTVCGGFALSSAAAQRWFARARPVDRRTWREQLDWTHCAAEGTLVDTDGRRRRWRLDMSGRGRVIRSPAEDLYLAGPELPVARARPR